MELSRAERERFDEILDAVMETLPDGLHDLLAETPLIVEDHPAPELLAEFDLEDDPAGLCGLHSGTPITERSTEHGHEPPEMIHLFRAGVIDVAGGWIPGVDEHGPYGGPEEIARQIRITILHEIGHHYGLDEDDLDALGYA